MQTIAKALIAYVERIFSLFRVARTIWQNRVAVVMKVHTERNQKLLSEKIFNYQYCFKISNLSFIKYSGIFHKHMILYLYFANIF